MVEAYGLKVLYADYVAYSSLINDALESAEVGRIAQHVAHTDEASVLTGLTEDVGALLGRLRNRFLEQHIVAGCESPHAGVIVNVVGGGDDDCIGELRHTEHLRPVAELMFGRYTIGGRHLLASYGIDIRYAYYLQ